MYDCMNLTDTAKGHYDSVIHHFRESLLSTIPPSPSSTPHQPYTWPNSKSLMQRIYALLPSPASSSSNPDPNDTFPPAGSSTHVLHLARNGNIQAHVDNVDASGSVIIGVSLGAERVLRLREKRESDPASAGEEVGGGGDERGGWDVLLPNGSLYIQRYVSLTST